MRLNPYKSKFEELTSTGLIDRAVKILMQFADENKVKDKDTVDIAEYLVQFYEILVLHKTSNKGIVSPEKVYNTLDGLI